MIPWLKTHKLTLVLLAAVAWLLYSRYSPPPIPLPRTADFSPLQTTNLKSISFPRFNGSTNPDVPREDRKIVTETNLSLLVKNVRAVTGSLKSQAESLGGFMVSSSLTSPEEADSGQITVRVPSPQLDAFLSFSRNQSVRVVSENIHGTDITDQYMDIEARLATLSKTKSTFEGILAKATNVDEILRVQQALLSVQDQIDSLKGQLKYLDNTSSTTLITLYLSTDELALPYAPAQPWRPSVIFKQAVRSLVLSARNVGAAAIWLAVYSVFWIPAAGLIWYFSRKKIKN